MKNRGIVLTSLSAIIFGITPLLTRILLSYGLDVVSISFYRYALILPFLFILCKWKKVSLRISKRNAWYIFALMSFFSTATMLLLNSSYLYINTGIATTLHFLYPLLVILICKYFYRDTIDGKTKKALVLIAIGIACFFVKVKLDNIIGLGMALLSSVTYAIYLVEMEKKGLSKLHPLVFSFYVSLDTSLLLFLVRLFVPSLAVSITSPAIAWLSIFSFMSILALTFLQLGSKYIGAKLTSLFSLFEPVTSLIAGVTLLQEELTVWKLGGCVLIFIAVMYLATGKTKQSIKEEGVH